MLGSGKWATKQFDSYTFANMPSATGLTGKVIYISDIGVGGSYWASDGSRFRAVGGRYLLSNITTPIVSNGTTTESIIKQTTLPIGLFKTGDYLIYDITVYKNGNVDTNQVAVRQGPLGTTADPISNATSQLATTIRTIRMEWPVLAATGNVAYGVSTSGSGWGTTSGTTNVVTYVQSSVNYVSLTAKMTTGGIETATYYEANLYHITGG